MSQPTATMLTGIEVITPDRAKEILRTNTHNRKLKPYLVTRYAKTMRDGQWTTSHQGIAFDEDGNLVDGQHRMEAVVLADVAVPFLVTYGIQKRAVRDIDTGSNRTIADGLLLADNMLVDEDVIATVKALYRGISKNHTPLLRHEVLACLQQHQDAVNFAVQVLPKSFKYVSRGPIRAAVARAFYYEQRDRLRAFADVLISGMPTAPNDGAAILLRNFVVLDPKAKGAGGAGVIYAKAIRAIRAFCAGETLAKLYPAAEELYPLQDR